MVEISFHEPHDQFSRTFSGLSGSTCRSDPGSGSSATWTEAVTARDHISIETTAYCDPARRIFADIPSTPTVEQFHGFQRGAVEYGRPERVVAQSRPSRPFNTMANNLNGWPRKQMDGSMQDWPKKPLSGSLDGLTPPPKPPSYNFEIPPEDRPLSRFTKSNTFSEGYSEEPNNFATDQLPLHRHSVPVIRPLAELATSDRSIRNYSAHQSVPAPAPANSMFPLPNSRSQTQMRDSFEPFRRPQWVSRSSDPASTDMRHFNINHSLTITTESVRTPVVEVGSPMSPLTSADAQSSPPLSSRSSESGFTPSTSPPPPYGERKHKAKRRMDSFYNVTSRRSEQIISDLSQPMRTTSQEYKTPSDLTRTFADSVEIYTSPTSRSAPSLIIQEPRPLSSFFIMTDDTVEALPATASSGSSMHTSSPPVSARPSVRNRPISVSSASDEGSVERSSLPISGRHSRSYSIPEIMADEATDYKLKKVESAPPVIKRKPVASRIPLLDTHKEVIGSVTTGWHSDTMKELSSQSSVLPKVDTAVGLGLNQSSWRQLETQQPNTPRESSKELVNDLASEVATQPTHPEEPTSHLAMIRRKNLERRKDAAAKRVYRVVNT